MNVCCKKQLLGVSMADSEVFTLCSLLISPTVPQNIHKVPSSKFSKHGHVYIYTKHTIYQQQRNPDDVRSFFPAGLLSWGWESTGIGRRQIWRTGVEHMITMFQYKQTVRQDWSREKKHGMSTEVFPPLSHFISPAWTPSQQPAFGKVNDRAIFLTLVCKDCVCRFSKNNGCCWYSNGQQ